MSHETLESVARDFLRQMQKKGMIPVPVQHESRLGSQYFYREDSVSETKRLDKEFKKNRWADPRFEINEENLPDRFVLKYGKKYFYGFKDSEAKWTHDSRLALAVSEIEADALMQWLEAFGTPTHRFPAPRGEQ